MKIYVKIIFFVVFGCNMINAQVEELNVNQTIDYINNLIGTLTKEQYGGESTKHMVSINENGFINIQQYMYRKDKSLRTIFENKFYYADIIFSEDKYYSSKGDEISFTCRKDYQPVGLVDNVDPPLTGWGLPTEKESAKPPNCIETKSGSKNEVVIKMKTSYDLKKMLNAFQYLYFLIETDGSYNRNDEYDPFAPNNFEQIEKKIIGSKSEGFVNLKKQNGVNLIPLKIGNVEEYFVLDSGASSVMINRELEAKLIKRGQLKKTDYISSALYRIADGSIVSSRRFIAKKISIGPFELENVIVAVGGRNAPLLLGNTLLDQFSDWSINNSDKKLVLVK